jgi:septal ring factor EnvC (AmiA/AmiB activator)
MVKDKILNIRISHLIMGAIILFLLWFALLKPTKNDSSKYDKQKQQIDSLNNVLNGLKKEQVELDKSIKFHQTKIDSLDYEIDSTNQQITNIRNYYGKKIRDIANYTPSQLDDFFSKRYK